MGGGHAMGDMSEGWERLTTEMLRHMLREFPARPAEFLTFQKLAFLIRVIAEQRRDLFIIAGNDRCLKLLSSGGEADSGGWSGESNTRGPPMHNSEPSWIRTSSINLGC
jgi:hypothetical protein